VLQPSYPLATWKLQGFSAITEFNIITRDSGRAQKARFTAVHCYFPQQRVNVLEKERVLSIPTSPHHLQHCPFQPHFLLKPTRKHVEPIILFHTLPFERVLLQG